MNKHIIILCSALLYTSSVYAKEQNLAPGVEQHIDNSVEQEESLLVSSAPTIDLQTALSKTYSTNENIKIAQQQFLTDSEEFPKALGQFLPDIGLTIASSKTKQTNTSRLAKGSSEIGPDVSRNLQVKQNIFNGGKSTYAIKKAQAGFQRNKATLYSAEQKTLMDALSTYLDLWGAEEKYNIAIEAVGFYAQNLNMVREKKNVGNATITDLAAAEAEFAKANANKSQQFANLMAARMTFQSVVGTDASNLAYPNLPDNLPENLESFKAIVEKSNFDLIAAKSILSQSRDDIKVQAADLLPKADLIVSAGRNYYDPESIPNSRVNSRTVSAQVSLTIPILTQGGVVHSAVRTAKYKSRQAVYGLDYTKKQVTANITSNWEGFIALKDSINSSAQAIASQSVALEGVKSGYEVETLTMLDVLQQQDKLNQLKSQNVDVKTQYLKVAYQLKMLMGQMTAQKLKLTAKYFNPESEFRNLKHKIVGF